MPRRRPDAHARIILERSPGFADDLKRQRSAIQKKVIVFLRRKKRGEQILGKERNSGYRPDGSVVYQPYVDLRFRHYHLGNPDPILVFQQLEEGRRLRLIAIVRHSEAFHGNERNFLERHGDDVEQPC